MTDQRCVTNGLFEWPSEEPPVCERQVAGSPRVGYSRLHGAPSAAGVSIVST